MDKKIYIKLLKYFDQQLYGDKKTETNWLYQGNNLDELFENYKYRDDYLDIDDYLEEKANVKFKDESFEDAYGILEQKMRLNFIIAIYNIFYYSEIDSKIKQRLYKFLNKQGIIFNDNSYKEPLNKKIIGEGAYANVIEKDIDYVYKQLKSEYWNHNDKTSRFKNEYSIQNDLANNTSFLNVFDYNELEYKYTMERAECSLEEYLKKNKNITLEKKVEMIFQILDKIEFLHKQEIIHRDLHIGNILYKKGDFFLVDYGFAKSIEIVRSRITSYSTKINHMFASPESFRTLKDVDKLSDIYSIGKIIDIIMSGDISFDKSHELKHIVLKCCKGEKKERFESIGRLKESIKDLILNNSEIENQKKTEKDIKRGIMSLDVELYILDLLRKGKLATKIFEEKWEKLDCIILKLEEEAQAEIIGYLFEKAKGSTRYNKWEDYSILGKIAFNLLRTKYFSVIQEEQLCELLNYCSHRFDVNKMRNNIKNNYTTTFREKVLNSK